MAAEGPVTGTIRRTVVADPSRDTNWANQARCRGHENPNLWFPVSQSDHTQIAEAKAECRKCPVTTDCEAYAKAHKPAGIWGGLTEDERDQAAADQQRIARRDRRTPIEHGTYRGYSLHRARKVPMCEPCRAANVAYEQERKARKRKEAVAS